MSFYNSVCYFLHAPKPPMKRRAVFLAQNLETLGMVPFLVPGLCSTKCYLLVLICNFWWRIIFFDKKWQNLYSFENTETASGYFRDLYCFKNRKKKCELFLMSIEEQLVNCVRHTRSFTQIYFSFNLFMNSINMIFKSFLRIFLRIFQ